MELCALLEKTCIGYGDLDTSLELPRHLRQICAGTELSYGVTIFLIVLNHH